VAPESLLIIDKIQNVSVKIKCTVQPRGFFCENGGDLHYGNATLLIELGHRIFGFHT
jgi:hypothetical protein